MIIMDNGTGAEIFNKYKNAANRLILLDYDGTLVKHTSKPETAKLPVESAEIIRRLMHKPDTKVFIITGRSQPDIDRFLNHIPINIIAEHGAIVKNDGFWNKQLTDDDAWKENILPLLKKMTSECKGSFIEEKNFSLAWHYRNSDKDVSYRLSRELIDLLGKKIKADNLKILDGNKVVEVMSVFTGKGLAVQRLFESENYDFILTIGDDATDEEMFIYFRNNTRAVSVKVGEGPTNAGYKLNDIGEVTALLKQLAG